MPIFARYDGVSGEATDADHMHWIEVRSVDWGASALDAGATGRSRRRGDVKVEEMTLSIDYEKASPKILEKLLKGVVIPELEIEVTRVGHDDAPATYLRWELENVRVTSYEVNASGDSDAGRPTVKIANQFEEIKVTYTEYGSDGSNKGNVETRWRAPS